MKVKDKLGRVPYEMELINVDANGFATCETPCGHEFNAKMEDLEESGFNPISDVEWSSYLACGVIEGFESADCNEVEAWAYLINTGVVWQLQGFYGRTAASLIESDFITNSGTINWSKIEENEYV